MLVPFSSVLLSSFFSDVITSCVLLCPTISSPISIKSILDGSKSSLSIPPPILLTPFIIDFFILKALVFSFKSKNN